MYRTDVHVHKHVPCVCVYNNNYVVILTDHVFRTSSTRRLLINIWENPSTYTELNVVSTGVNSGSVYSYSVAIYQ